MEMLVPVRNVLMSNPDLYTLVGQRIYAHRDNPPKGYNISQGPCICLKVRGGVPEYSGALITPSVQIKCIGRDEAEALRVFSVLYDTLHEYIGPVVRWAECENYGQVVYEPDANWVTVLTFFKVRIAK